MKVHEFIEKLNGYNPKAEIEILIGNYPREFSIKFGGSEGCTDKSCDFVCLEVIGYNISEDV